MTKVKLSKLERLLWEITQETENVIFFIRDLDHFEDEYNKILIDKIEKTLDKIYNLADKYPHEVDK